MVHRGYEKRHGSAGARSHDSLRCKSGGDIAGESVNDVRIRREIDGDHLNRKVSISGMIRAVMGYELKIGRAHV